MKKVIFFAIVAAVTFVWTGCSEKKSTTTDATATTAAVEDRNEVYAGIMPAADASGINYKLVLDYDDDNGNVDGDYDLEMTYLTSDSVGQVFESEGEFFVDSRNGKQYIRLVPEKQAEATEVMYFIIDSDSTITLVDSTLQVTQTPGLNYTLQKVK